MSKKPPKYITNQLKFESASQRLRLAIGSKDSKKIKKYFHSIGDVVLQASIDQDFALSTQIISLLKDNDISTLLSQRVYRPAHLITSIKIMCMSFCCQRGLEITKELLNILKETGRFHTIKVIAYSKESIPCTQNLARDFLSAHYFSQAHNCPLAFQENAT